jgi:alkanesulfonate monooxygenase SsuD/methylene tetrahydromethanopterin reductase-like flavin-dependent oxidoreductase (luciferase family)
MRFGFSPTQSRARFDAMCAQAGLAEALGFDVIWAHEHHSGGSTYPSPLMTLAALDGVTTRIELGTNMLLLPLHHPLRVAEDAAMVDVCPVAGCASASAPATRPPTCRHSLSLPMRGPGGCARAWR